jgi:hypothetical protein
MPCPCDIERPDSNPYEGLDTDAPRILPMRRPDRRRGRIVRAFGHSTALRCSPAMARAIAGVR